MYFSLVKNYMTTNLDTLTHTILEKKLFMLIIRSYEDELIFF